MAAFLGEFRRPGGGFLCPRRQRNQNAVLEGPLRREISSGGQTLSGVCPSFRVTGPWQGGGLDLPLLPGPPGLCQAVEPGGGSRADEDIGPYGKTAVLGVGAGVLTGPPMTHQPLRLQAPGALSSSSRTAFFQDPSQRQRRGKEGNQLNRPRRMRGTTAREVSPVTGVRGRATGVLALLGAGPRRFFRAFLIAQKGTNRKRKIPPLPRRNPTQRGLAPADLRSDP